ncbi:imidazoleglycerol-phosphate dehydratase HisB [bacterium]|nr:imidazoleglycerol-phosphate dehydratase HisB [bacterium]
MKRQVAFERNTKETQIKGNLLIDGKGIAKIDTGIGFLDHMLELFSFHSSIDLNLKCKGDLKVCAHHSIEDIAISLGSAFNKALGERVGITRYATCYLPMDETLTRTSIDISGRPYHVFIGGFSNQQVGILPTEMIKHFFYSFCMEAKLTLHQEIMYGENDHHKSESLFKGFAKCLAKSVVIESDKIPSTKGQL